jgi:hypothetical protein
VSLNPCLFHASDIYAGLPIGVLGFNFKDKKVRLFSGGDIVVHSVTTTKLGEAIARVLLKPKAYLNRNLYLTTIKYTQNEVLRIIEAKTGSKFEVENTTSEDTVAYGEQLAKTDPVNGGYVIIGGLVYDDKEQFSPNITRKDAEELGLEEDDLKTVVERVLASA